MTRLLIGAAVLAGTFALDIWLVSRRADETPEQRMRQLNRDLAAGGDRRGWFV